MNAERVPFEALKERSRVCFGGFCPPHFVFGEEYGMMRNLKPSRFDRDSVVMIRMGWQ
jgi:hypothetical protein